MTLDRELKNKIDNYFASKTVNELILIAKKYHYYNGKNKKI